MWLGEGLLGVEESEHALPINYQVPFQNLGGGGGDGYLAPPILTMHFITGATSYTDTPNI